MKTVAVFFGSKSTEHDVSIVTALSSVIKPLELTGKYKVVPVYIAKDGAWYSDAKLKEISLFSSGEIDNFIKDQQPVGLKLGNGLQLVKPAKFGKSKVIDIDIAFPATHGTFGEDGSLMGLLRMAGVPYVGCDMEASVIAMNKLLSHAAVGEAGIEGYPYIGVQREEFNNDRQSVLNKCDKLTYPIFVKPVRLGSSIGITRVEDVIELERALEVAFSYDSTAIVEEAVPNLIEVTVPVMGRGGSARAACVERPLIDTGGTFDFETKYMNQSKTGGKKSGGKSANSAQGYSELPAKIDQELYAKSEQLALDVYKAVGCEGIARIDLLIDNVAKKVYFNEINPLPGSLYAHNWRAAGVSGVELVNNLVKLAEDRHAEQASKTTTNFATNFLKQF